MGSKKHQPVFFLIHFNQSPSRNWRRSSSFGDVSLKLFITNKQLQEATQKQKKTENKQLCEVK